MTAPVKYVVYELERALVVQVRLPLASDVLSEAQQAQLTACFDTCRDLIETVRDQMATEVQVDGRCPFCGVYGWASDHACAPQSGYDD